MPNVPAVTMHDLEREEAELLPSRETLSCYTGHPSHGGYSFSQSNWGIGNTNQAGFLNVSALNGDFSGNGLYL
jgi:hypothetical protein